MTNEMMTTGATIPRIIMGTGSQIPASAGTNNISIKGANTASSATITMGIIDMTNSERIFGIKFPHAAPMSASVPGRSLVVGLVVVGCVLKSAI